MTRLEDHQDAPPGLANLSRVELRDDLRAMYDLAQVQCVASAPLRARICAEVYDLLAMSQLAERMRVARLDTHYGLRAVVRLQVPVPRRRTLDSPLEIHPEAFLALTYSPRAFVTASRGYEFWSVLLPAQIFHANVSPDASQALCLGQSLPAGIRVKDLVLMAYGALSMQSVQVDMTDPAGVLNPIAAEWWGANLDRVPLSAEPFLPPRHCK